MNKKRRSIVRVTIRRSDDGGKTWRLLFRGAVRKATHLTRRGVVRLEIPGD